MTNEIKIDTRGGSIQGSNIGKNNNIINIENQNDILTNKINQLESETSEKAEISKLLQQLQKEINSEEMPEEIKAEALEELEAIIEAAENLEDKKNKRFAKGAIETLKNLSKKIPEIAFAEAFRQILINIHNLF